MSLPFTNVHIHIFNSACAPDRFLRILPVNFVRRFPAPIKSVLGSKSGRKIIHGLNNIFTSRKSNKRSEVDKYVSFLDVGTETSQLEVFKRALDVGQNFDSDIRIVALTMNMDYMDSQPSVKQISFETQLEVVKDIKRYYPANFFPFIGIDPRHKAGNNLVHWARPYMETGVTDPKTSKAYPYFSGFKLYPALGFFPFDPRLEQLYQYAEMNNLPVMTHCTRSGSQYIGNQIENLIPLTSPMISMEGNHNIETARTSIRQRIKAFKDKGWIKNSKLGANDIACDLFGNPENYIPVLEKFPSLKICLAHMGGSSEILDAPKAKRNALGEIRSIDTPGWFSRITEMMKVYPNLYTDISYTLNDFGNTDGEVYKRIVTFLNTPDNFGNLLGDRVLFGTDFFMTEQENRELKLYEVTIKNLADWMDRIARVNPQKFLMQPL